MPGKLQHAPMQRSKGEAVKGLTVESPQRQNCTAYPTSISFSTKLNTPIEGYPYKSLRRMLRSKLDIPAAGDCHE
jgi:hypothetical protein